jgi:hypothetical protein
LKYRVASAIVVAVPYEPAEAILLAEVDDLRRATHASSEWRTGSLTAAATLTARFYRRRSSSLGMVPKYRRYWLLWLAITFGAFAVPAIAPAGAKAAGAWLVISVGYAVAAAIARSARLAALSVMLGGASAVLVSVSATTATGDVVCGLILIAGGLAARRADHVP